MGRGFAVRNEYVIHCDVIHNKQNLGRTAFGIEFFEKAVGFKFSNKPIDSKLSRRLFYFIHKFPVDWLSPGIKQHDIYINME
jgi:hypothetical protein